MTTDVRLRRHQLFSGTKSVIEAITGVNIYVWSVVVLSIITVLCVTLAILIRPSQSGDYITKILGFVAPILVTLMALSQRAQTHGLNGRLTELRAQGEELGRRTGKAEAVRTLIWQQSRFDPQSPEWCVLEDQIRELFLTNEGAPERRKPPSGNGQAKGEA